MGKWFQLALHALPLVGILVPGAGPLVPFIQDGILAAQGLHGDTNNDAKRRIVLDGAAAASASGKLTIDPETAIRITDSVLNTIDGIHAIAKANHKVSEAPPPANP